MSFEPNMTAAREAFAKRVTDAYLTTWHGYGFVGPQFNQEKAEELGRDAAKYAFPTLYAPIILKKLDDSDLAALREEMGRPGPIIAARILEDDGVVGD